MKRLITYILFYSLLILGIGCHSKVEIPAEFIISNINLCVSVSNISQYSATVSGESSCSLKYVQGYGFTLLRNGSIIKTVNGQNDNENNFGTVISELLPNTEYKIFAYINNTESTIHSDTIGFKTQPTKIPSVMTVSVGEITSSNVVPVGKVVSDCGLAILEKGFCIDSVLYTASGPDSVFSCKIDSLQPNTLYNVCAYAINELGISFGNDIQFRTDASLPKVSTVNVTDIESRTAICGGNILSTGNTTITTYGICWSTSHDPDTTGCKTIQHEVKTSFVSTISDLTPNTTYYVRAYATNQAGTSYGNEAIFKTNAEMPQVATKPVQDINGYSATSGGIITYNGNTLILSKGVCWGLFPTLSIENSTHAEQGCGNSEYISYIDSLQPMTTYYVRAFATNSVGTAYGEVLSFTTTKDAPSVLTGTVTNVTLSSATISGSIVSDGLGGVTDKGICWGLKTDITIQNAQYISAGSGFDNFKCNLTNLDPDTHFYVRAYAKNDYGTKYGQLVEFTTRPSGTAEDLEDGDNNPTW